MKVHPETMIGHVHLTVADLERSLACVVDRALLRTQPIDQRPRDSVHAHLPAEVSANDVDFDGMWHLALPAGIVARRRKRRKPALNRR